MTAASHFFLYFLSFFCVLTLRALKWCATRHVTPNEHRELHWWKTAQNHTKRAFAHVFISKMTVKKSNLSKSRKKVFDGSFEGAELPCVIIFAWFRIHLAVACETFSHNAVFSHCTRALCPKTLKVSMSRCGNRASYIAPGSRALYRVQCHLVAKHVRAHVTPRCCRERQSTKAIVRSPLAHCKASTRIA